MSILIRRAVPEDCAGIAKVHIDSWRTTYKCIVNAEYLSSLSYADREKRWETILGNSEIDQHRIYVAVNQESEIVGFADGGPGSSDDSTYNCQLYSLYLLEKYQRQGIGQQLVKAVVEELSKQYQSMLVWVLADNESRYFYEGLGAKYVREAKVTIGQKEYDEIAYGWSDLQELSLRLNSRKPKEL